MVNVVQIEITTEMVINSKVCSGQRSFATHVKVCKFVHKASRVMNFKLNR